MGGLDVSTLKTRHLGIDLLRCFAIICVVLNHCTEAVYSLTLDGVSSLSLASKIFAFCAFTAGRIGVPCFMTMSGYLLMDRFYSPEQRKNFWINSWFHLLVCTWVWFTIYDLILCFQGQNITWSDYVSHMLFLQRVGFSHVWYMPAILGIYLLIPIVSNGLFQIGYKSVTWILAVYFLYCFVAPWVKIVSAATGGEPFSVQISSGFSGGAYGLYFLFGAMVKKGFLKKVPTQILSFLTILSFCGTVYFQLWCYHLHYKYNVWYDFPLLLVIGVCLLEIFSRIATVPGKPIIVTLSKYSFAVYLIHNTILNPLRPWISSLNLLLPIKVMGLLVPILTASYIISILLARIPKVGPYLLYLKPTTPTHRT